MKLKTILFKILMLISPTELGKWFASTLLMILLIMNSKKIFICSNRIVFKQFRLPVFFLVKSIWLFILFWGVVPSLKAQNTFNVVFKRPGIERADFMIENSQGSILAVGGTSRLDNPSKGTIWKIDKNNDTLEMEYDISGFHLNFNYLEETVNDYLLTGFATDTSDVENTKLLIFRLNFALEVVWQKTVPLNCELYSGKLKKSGNNYYLLMSASQNSGHPDPYFIKFDSEFDTVRTYHSGYLVGGQYIYDFMFSQDGTQIYVFSDNYIFDINDLGDSNEIIFYDTAFNYLGYNNFPYDGLNGLYGNYIQGQWMTDTTLLLFCNYKTESDHKRQHCFMEMDTAMNIYNRNIFGVPDTNDVGCLNSHTYSFSNPDSIHYAGTKNFIIDLQPDDISWLRVGMLNRHLQHYYMRFYGGDAQYWIEYVLHTRDGGMVIHAIRLEDFTYAESDWDAFFFKVDKNGLITGNTNPEICPIRAFILSPNPGTNEVILELASGHAQLLILDINGNQVQTQQINQGCNKINTSSLPAGIYLFTVTDENNYTESQKWIKQ